MKPYFSRHVCACTAAVTELSEKCEFGSYRRLVGLNRLREQEEEQRAAGEGEREHHCCHGGAHAERPRAAGSLVCRGFRAEAGHSLSALAWSRKRSGTSGLRSRSFRPAHVLMLLRSGRELLRGVWLSTRTLDPLLPKVYCPFPLSSCQKS